MSAWDAALKSAGANAMGIEATESDAELSRLVEALEKFTLQVQRIEALASLVGTPSERVSTRDDLDILASNCKQQSLLVARLFTESLQNARERSEARDKSRVRNKLRRDYEREKRRFAELIHDVAEKEREVPRVQVDPGQGGSPSVGLGPGNLQAPLLQSFDSEEQISALIARERGEEIEKLANSVQEINQIYKELGEIVEEQQVGLDDIESHVSEARERAQAGFREVQSASRIQNQGNKMLAYGACAFITLAIIAILIAFGDQIFK